MPRFSVKIEGNQLLAAQIQLNGANIPTLGTGLTGPAARPRGGTSKPCEL